MKRVEGKIALVTGGNGGIGAATARLLRAEGASVVVTDLASPADRPADGMLFLQHDVSKEDHWRRVVGQTMERFGRLDVLVNNAGIGFRANVEDTTLEDWRRLMSVNLDGVFLGTRMGIEAMRASGGGSIVNISSIEGLVGDPDLAAYNASKGGVRLFTKSAALHCARLRSGIRVNSVHPGYIWTPMVAHSVERTPAPDETRRALERLHPVGHLGTPEDIAYGVLYLASDEAKFVTGAELVIDGGYTAQ